MSLSDFNAGLGPTNGSDHSSLLTSERALSNAAPEKGALELGRARKLCARRQSADDFYPEPYLARALHHAAA
jgi:hypothetical protein